MTGAVNADLEAVIPVTVFDAEGQPRVLKAIVDTGFNGYLTLPPKVIEQLNLPWLCRQQGLLADGNLQVFDVFVASMNWEGQPRDVEVEAADTQPLRGMAAMLESTLQIHVANGGSVEIGRP